MGLRNVRVEMLSCEREGAGEREREKEKKRERGEGRESEGERGGIRNSLFSSDSVDTTRSHFQRFPDCSRSQRAGGSSSQQH